MSLTRSTSLPCVTPLQRWTVAERGIACSGEHKNIFPTWFLAFTHTSTTFATVSRFRCAAYEFSNSSEGHEALRSQLCAFLRDNWRKSFSDRSSITLGDMAVGRFKNDFHGTLEELEVLSYQQYIQQSSQFTVHTFYLFQFLKYVLACNLFFPHRNGHMWSLGRKFGTPCSRPYGTNAHWCVR